MFSIENHLLQDNCVTQRPTENHNGVITSKWSGHQDINTHSIGIEVVNWDYLHKSADGNFHTSNGKVAEPTSDAVEARHKLSHVPHTFWHSYTSEQTDGCRALANLLIASYGMEDIVGHDDIAPSRKQDLGPTFPLISIAYSALGRDSAQMRALAMATVKSGELNKLQGPSISHPIVAPPLSNGTQMRILRGLETDWMEVEPLRADNRLGWGFAPYMQLA